MNWTQIVSHSNNVFEFSTIEPLRRQPNESDMEINDAKDQNDSGRLDSRSLQTSDVLGFISRDAPNDDGPTGRPR